MLPSFVIGLREGLEAALIVGIIAAFLRKQGRRDLLRSVMVGVGVAVVLCLGIGIALRAFSQNLPQKEQEGLETVIAVLAIGMVTYMVVWMRRNSRNLKGQLESLASEAMTQSSNGARAMVAMAFLAVIREGLETVVFLLAAFNESANGATAGVGALLGLLVAVALGYGIYRGGVRLNLSKFFRATGAVLVLVAAGLVVNAVHTAHEAGWVNVGQQQTLDLTWLVEPGTVQASLLTGMLGLQPRPVLIEVVLWLVYLVPVGLYVVWPPGRPVPRRAAIRGGLALAALAGVTALVLALVAPDEPGAGSTSLSGVQLTGRSATGVTVLGRPPASLGPSEGEVRLPLRRAGAQDRAGLPTERYSGRIVGASSYDGPATLPVERVAQLNGGRLPTGIRITDGSIPVRYRSGTTVTVWVDPRTDRLVDVRWTRQVLAVAGTAANNAQLDRPVTGRTAGTSDATVRSAAQAARAAHDDGTRRSQLLTAAVWCAVVALLAVLTAVAFALTGRRRTDPAPAREPTPPLVRS
ncbi:FTR1 family iron permease [Jatrophihabitans fulvus]